MVRVLKAYIKAQLQISFAYRGMLIIWALDAIIAPLVLLMTWLTIQGQDQGLAYSQNDFLVYFFLMPFVVHFVASWMIYYIPEQIREGEFSVRLLRPFNPILPEIASNITEKSIKIVFTALLWIPLFFILFPEIKFATKGMHFILFIFAIFLGAVLRFMMDYCICMTAFWLDSSRTLNTLLVDVGYMIFGGKLIPLQLFEGNMRRLVSYMPYRYFMSFPIEIFQGKLDSREIGIGFGIGLLYLVSLHLLNWWMYQYGQKKYIAAGG